MNNFDLKKWWNKKDEENKLWFLYKSLAIIALLAGLIVGEGAIKFIVMGAVVLIVLHLVIWPFFTETTSATTKFFVGGFLVFCVIAFFIPNYTDRTMSKIKAAVTDFDENYGKNKTQGQQVANKAPIPAKEPEAQKLYLVPGENFRRAKMPYGHTIIENQTGSCPQGCIFEIEHDSDQLCPGDGDIEIDRSGNSWFWGMYQGRRCLTTAFPGRLPGVIRYRERFLHSPKSKAEYPGNLREVILSYGASWGISPNDKGLGPVVALVKVATR